MSSTALFSYSWFWTWLLLPSLENPSFSRWKIPSLSKFPMLLLTFLCCYILHFFFFFYKYQWVENLMNPSYIKKPTSRTPVHASDISIQSNKQPWVPASWVTRIIAYTEDILYLYLWISLLSFSEASSVLLPVLSLRQGVQNGTQCSRWARTIFL